MTIAKEVQVAGVAENLQLLPDFRANVLVVWKERRKLALEIVNIGKREIRLANFLNAAHNFQEPTARFSPTLFDEAQAVPLR